jgi:hypothetical protein
MSSDRKLKRKIKQNIRTVKRICDKWILTFDFDEAIEYVDLCEYKYSIEFKFTQFYLYTMRFFFLFSDENILNKISNDIITHGIIKYKTVSDLPYQFLIYGSPFLIYGSPLISKPLIKYSITEPPIKNKIRSMYLECDNIINSLIILKKTVKEFIISKYNECLKHSEYAEEECLAQEKLLLSLSKINKYNADIDKLVTNIIMSPIQKHTFCISTRINININDPLYEMFDVKIKLRKPYQGTYELYGTRVFQFLCDFITGDSMRKFFL